MAPTVAGRAATSSPALFVPLVAFCEDSDGFAGVAVIAIRSKLAALPFALSSYRFALGVRLP
jgi:hypothetical protein